MLYQDRRAQLTGFDARRGEAEQNVTAWPVALQGDLEHAVSIPEVRLLRLMFEGREL